MRESGGDTLSYDLDGDPRFKRFATPEAAVAYLREAIAQHLKDAVLARGKALWIGAGGATPKPVYEALNAVPLNWDKIILSQVDERFVPVDQAASNTKMMREALKESIAKGLCFETLVRNDRDLNACVAEAETMVRGWGQGQSPRFDACLLGMGNDAHYASIFPGHPLTGAFYDNPEARLIMAVPPFAPEPTLPRLTLTPMAINASRHIWLYITGKTKLTVLEQALKTPDAVRLPIGAYLAQCPAPIEIIWSE